MSKRSRLPIESRKEDIIKIIRDNRVIVLSGSTGCGKVIDSSFHYYSVTKKKSTETLLTIIFNNNN